MTDSIDINRKGEVVTEMSGRVRLDEKGRPLLEPLPGQVGRWNAVLARHAGKGQVRVAISRVSERRSHAQNRLLWLIYRQIMEGLRERALDVGERCPLADEDELHEAMKHLFIGRSLVKVGAEKLELAPTTTTLTVEQFSTYTSNVIAWAARHSIYVELEAAS